MRSRYHTLCKNARLTKLSVQSLKGKDDDEISFIKRLEPEIKLFRFQKSDCLYDELSDEEKLEEQMSMKNGINYARKVLTTEECSMLVLDEVLGLVDKKVISAKEKTGHDRPVSDSSLFVTFSDSAPSCDDSHSILHTVPRKQPADQSSSSAFSPFTDTLLPLPHPAGYC